MNANFTPVITCSTHKKVFLTAELAEEALLGAQTRFDYAKGQGPIATYRCEDCGYYHLTSRGPMNGRLESELKKGNIDRQKEADSWEQKLKHKR